METLPRQNQPQTLWPSQELVLAGNEVPATNHPKSVQLPAVMLHCLLDVIHTWRSDVLFEGAPLAVGNVLPGYTVPFALNRLETFPEPVVFERAFLFAHGPVGTYGHFMLEMAPKLVVYRALLRLDPTLPLAVPTSAPGWVYKWIKLLVPEAVVATIAVGAAALVKTAYCCDLLSHNYFVGAAFQSFLTACHAIEDTGDAPEKILIRRTLRRSQLSDFRALENEQEIADTLDGFIQIEPERLTIEQQIRTFSRAKIIVGELSSGLHNSIFSPSGVRVVQLNPFNQAQRRLSLSLGHSLVSLLPDDGVLRGYPAAGAPSYRVCPARVLEAALI